MAGFCSAFHVLLCPESERAGQAESGTLKYGGHY